MHHTIPAILRGSGVHNKEECERDRWSAWDAFCKLLRELLGSPTLNPKP